MEFIGVLLHQLMKDMVQAYLYGILENLILENGKMIECKEMEFIFYQMEPIFMANFLKIKLTDQRIFNLKIKIPMNVIGNMEKWKEIVINIFSMKINGLQMNIKMEFFKKWYQREKGSHNQVIYIIF